MDKPLKSVTHGQCYARHTVTFPVAWHHRPLISTKLYCLVTEPHVCVCEQLAQGCYMEAERPGLAGNLLSRESNALITTPPSRAWYFTPNHQNPVVTRSSAIAEGPLDASCQLKSCQLLRNSAETTCTTSPEPSISCR